MDLWLFEYDGNLHLEDAATDEVADCKWMAVSEIRKLYEDKRIVSLDGEDIAEEKILGDISFQEQFFYGKLYQ